MKNKSLIIIAILLAAIAAYLYFSEKKGTIRQELRDFAVDDTATISKIFLADKAGNEILLERLDAAEWRLNKKYKVRKDLVNVLLKTMGTLEVKSPVARAARDNVIKRLASGAIKVEIYQGDEIPSKVYYVGGATQNTMGTYMLIENSSEPFIMHIPSFYGYLTPRYNTGIGEWRGTTVVSLSFKDIALISIDYPANRERSFEIKNTGNWVYQLKALENEVIVSDYDTTKLLVYLTNFTMVNFESIVDNLPKEKADSILNSEPLIIMKCTDLSGNTTVLKSYLKQAVVITTDLDGNPVLFDLDRLYAEIDGNGELLTIQYFVFDKLFLQLNDFKK